MQSVDRRKDGCPTKWYPQRCWLEGKVREGNQRRRQSEQPQPENVANAVVSVLPLDVGVCLFRVLQEALHNVVKYSETKRVEVEMREDSGEIHLIISDLGRGFDLETATQGRGLGLTSMKERVRLVNGTITIESKPMGGTTIRVRVPLESQQASQRKAV